MSRLLAGRDCRGECGGNLIAAKSILSVSFDMTSYDKPCSRGERPRRAEGSCRG